MGLVSQNIDNLHLRAGCSKNICEIHGNMKYVRCTNEHCVGTTKMTRDMIVYKKDIQAFVQRMEATPSVRYLEYTKKYGDPLPDIISWLKDNETIGDVPLCPKCCSYVRPNILFFDESYDEAIYSSSTAYNSVKDCDLMIVIGTMCTTSLPQKIIANCSKRNIPVIDINPNPNTHFKADVLQCKDKSDEILRSVIQRLNEKKLGVQKNKKRNKKKEEKIDKN